MEYETSFLGLVISLLFAALTGMYPGGIIVPGYLALYSHYPLRVAGTIAVALLTLLCFRLASRYLILFGARRFVFMILVAATWTVLWFRFFPLFIPGSIEFRVIGWIVPGLIANSFEKQGILVTGAAMATATVVTYLLSRIFHALSWI
ncbi:MAG TPA: poly-gamma-glutamate biosynthesis protein PgsC [Acidobacteriota bacterium]|nr:poly-gamma-glutamate biosynthesis protein PgsC [Acidobacteriota bacterium]